MAHYKRRRPRASPTHGVRGHLQTDWLNFWPRWHDVVFHRRPRRHRETETLSAILGGKVDPDAVVFHDVGRKPHLYYW